MGQKIKNYAVAFVIVLALVVVDQMTKLLAATYLNPASGGSDFVIWDGVFRLHYYGNTGASFGIMSGRRGILIVTTIIVFLALCWIYSRIPNERRFCLMQMIALFVFAGAIGNFVDRIRLGYVIDFFYFELINFPIFNVADIYITCSVALFLLLFLFYYKEADLERIWPSREKKDR